MDVDGRAITKIPLSRIRPATDHSFPNLCYDSYMIVSDLPDANPHHWRWGIFYFNRQDRRLFVPQRFGYGWTLNFANIWAWLLVGLIIFVLIARLLNRGVKGRA